MQRRGYTLIECLVVVATIMLLMTLLLPTLKGARREGRAIQCASNTRQWSTAFSAFANDHDGAFPPYTDRTPGRYYSGRWYNEAAWYLGLETIPDNDPLGRDKTRRVYYSELRTCTEGDAYIGVHYGGPNTLDKSAGPIVHSNKNDPGPNDAIIRFSRVLVDQIQRPSDWVLLLDVSLARMYAPARWPRTIDADGDGRPDSNNERLAMDEWVYNGARPRQHRDATNIAFCDGHVERVSFADWLDPDSTIWHDP